MTFEAITKKLDSCKIETPTKDYLFFIELNERGAELLIKEYSKKGDFLGQLAIPCKFFSEFLFQLSLCNPPIQSNLNKRKKIMEDFWK